MSKKSITALKQTIRFSFFALIVFWAASCEDEPQVLGLNLIPDSDKVSAQYVDTFTVYAHTEKIDSVYTKFSEMVAIGNLHDPIFGYTDASFLTEFYPTTDSVGGSDFELDSIKLQLYNFGYTGDSVSDMTLNVYTYANKIPADSLYSSYTIDESQLVKVGSGDYNPNESVIEFMLDEEFGNKLLSPGGKHINDVYDSIEAFNDIFPAIYFATDKKDNKGGINYFRTSASVSTTTGTTYYSSIKLYYNYMDDSVKTGSIRYIIGNGYGSFINVNMFKHDYTDATFDPSSANQDSVIYLQSLGGTKGVLNIPGLDDLFEANPTISVSSAKLILPVEDFDKSRYVFKESPYIGISAIDDEGSEYYLSDNNYYQPTNSSSGDVYYIDGAYNADSLCYELNITGHIESIFNKENENLGFNIFSANSSRRYNNQTLRRMVLTNHRNSNPIRLQIVYTKLSN